MTPSEKVAHDIAQAIADQEAADRRNIPPTGPNPFHGAGIGSLGDYAIFAAMIGAVIGAITGGVGGAIVWALLLGGLFRLPAMLRGGGSMNQGAVIRGVIVGAIAGAVLGLLLALGRDIFLGEDVPANKAFNMIVNFGVLGAVVLGGYRAFRRS